jgi:hypothetical protein
MGEPNRRSGGEWSKIEPHRPKKQAGRRISKPSPRAVRMVLRSSINLASPRQA